MGHVEWFRHGARALRAVAREHGFEHLLPTDEDWYLCPLCLTTLFSVDALDELSVEHVPPAACGGRGLVLTCRRCNTDHGSKFDAEADKQHRLRQLLSGQSLRPERAALTIDGITLRGDVRIGEDVVFAGIPQMNHSVEAQRLEDHMRTLSEAGITDKSFTVSLPRITYSPNHARVSWIRTAYLAAFALFGWKYILQKTLQPIREQLVNPLTVTLPLLSTYQPAGHPDRRQIWIVERPKEHQSLCVEWDRHRVFLPAPNDPINLDDLASRLGARTDGPVRHKLGGKIAPWPTKPMHVLDLPGNGSRATAAIEA